MPSNDRTLEPRESAGDFYQRYCETCRRLGVEPVSPERARELVEMFDATFESAKSTRQ